MNEQMPSQIPDSIRELAAKQAADERAQKEAQYAASVGKEASPETRASLAELSNTLADSEWDEAIAKSNAQQAADEAFEKDILKAIQANKGPDEGAEPLNPEAIAGEIEVDTSDLDKAS